MTVWKSLIFSSIHTPQMLILNNRTLTKPNFGDFKIFTFSFLVFTIWRTVCAGKVGGGVRAGGLNPPRLPTDTPPHAGSGVITFI